MYFTGSTYFSSINILAIVSKKGNIITLGDKTRIKLKQSDNLYFSVAFKSTISNIIKIIIIIINAIIANILCLNKSFVFRNKLKIILNIISTTIRKSRANFCDTFSLSKSNIL